MQQQAEAAAAESAAAKDGLSLSAGKPAAECLGAEAAEAVEAVMTDADAAQDSHAAEEAAAPAPAEPMETEQQEDLAHDAGDEDMQGTHDGDTAAVQAASSHAGLTEAADAEDASTAAAGPSSGATSQQQQGAEAEPAAAPAAKSNLVSSIRSFVQGIPKKEPAAPAQGKVKTKVGVLTTHMLC
jgi:hypothetical protein